MRRAWMTMLLTATVPAAAAAQAPPDAAARVDAIFERWSGESSPGCAVGVAHGGDLALSRAFGMADLEHGVPNTPATIFEAGSVAKQFTAAAVILLAQQGRLSLDDDVRTHVPELPDYGHRITLRHLLTHTSGLRDWGSVAEIAGWGRSARTHTHDHVLDILGRQRALNFAPGHEYSYSNSGYNLLAIIVDRASGMPFAEFSRRHIFEPLGMTDTQWRDDYTRIVPRRASAYAARGAGFVIDRPIENVHGNGGLLTTVGDLLRWNAALLEGRLGGEALRAEMLRRGVLNDGDTITYASGIVVSHYDDEPEISHTGATSGYRAFLARYPEKRLDVAVLCNVGNVNPGSVGQQVAAVYLGRPARVASTGGGGGADGETRETPTFAPTAAQLAAYAGTYYSPDVETELRVSVDAETGALVAWRRPATRLILMPVEDDGFMSPLGRIRFHRDGAGRITQLGVSQARVYDLRFERVPD